MTQNEDYDVTIVGAGLAGSLAAVLLGNRGLSVLLCEKNDDPRLNNTSSSTEDAVFGTTKNAIRRSINLALSLRGEDALRRAGVLDEILSSTVVMQGRLIHQNGKINFQPYGTRDQAIKSIGREVLNISLLNQAESLENVTIKFNVQLKKVEKNGECIFVDTASNTNKTISTSSKVVIGADGAYSQVRENLMRYSRADFSRKYIKHCYKELRIPPTESGAYALQSHGLHIWPRGSFMLIALPNPDKSFTCTLFAPDTQLKEMEKELHSGKNEKLVLDFFKTNFSDVTDLVPNLYEEFCMNPTGPLVTVSVNPWNYKDRILVLGDAAHACVPFYGQGMNSAFEDVLILDDFVEQMKGDIMKAVPLFADYRRCAGDAIADLSYENYLEMRSHTASRLFLYRKKVEAMLHWLFPSWWIPQYTMVAFSRIPYDIVQHKSKYQDKLLRISGYTLSFLTAAGCLSLLGFKFFNLKNKE